jgi:hypothetical protein
LRRVQDFRITLTVLGVAVLLASCGSDDDAKTVSTSNAQTPTATQTAAAHATSPLDGVWQTGFISPRDVAATLRRDGLAKWNKRFRSISPVADGATLILDLHDGEWDLYGKPRSGPREEIDYDAEYVVEGDRVTKIHGTGETVYRWSVDGDALELEWLSTTEPPAEGIPDEVFGRALYMTQRFMRQS